jgi:hypothetical protein
MRYIVFRRLSIFVFTIFLLNLAGSFFDWYVLLPWYDNLMHFLGGAWLGLLVSWIFFHKIGRGVVKIVTVMLFVLLGTLLWESLEYIVQFVTKSPGSLATPLDSISDIIFGLLGGLISGYRTIQFIKKQ